MKTNDPAFNYNKKKFYTLKIHPLNKSHPTATRKIYLNNNRIRDPTTKLRINNLKLPPAYLKNGTVVAKSPANDIQAMALNDNNQVQYFYHPKFIKKQTRKKYINVLNLGQVIQNIDTYITAKLPALAAKKTYTALDLYPIILFMLMKYHFRIGNVKYSNANKSYGITTIKPAHIKLLDAPRYEIAFTGKKGVNNHITDSNTAMYNILRKLKKNNRRYLFQLDDSGSLITPTMIKEFLLNKYNTYITPKMFRTWFANYHLLDYLYRTSRSAPDIPHTKLVQDAVNYVSTKLHNSPAISKKAYVNNKMFNTIINNPAQFIKGIPQSKNHNLHRYLYRIIKKNTR